MCQTENSRAAARTPPSLDQWRELYETAAALKKLTPWQQLNDHSFLIVELPEHEEPFYCSVMGMENLVYGIGVYPGNDAFLRLQLILEEEGHSPHLLMLEQCYLTCQFGDREDMTGEDREVMKSLGLRFRGRNQWPFFRSARPGQFPWFLTADEAKVLQAVLQNFLILFQQFKSGQLTADFEFGEALRRRYDPEVKIWVNEVIPLPSPDMRRAVMVKNDAELTKFKKRKKTKTELEIDSFYLPIPIQENPQEAPFAGHITLIVDHKSGEPLSPYIPERDEIPEQIPTFMLASYIQRFGRPAVVYVRSEWEGCLLRDFCEKIGVPLKIGSMRKLDAIVNSLMQFMGADDEGLEDDFFFENVLPFDF